MALLTSDASARLRLRTRIAPIHYSLFSSYNFLFIILFYYIITFRRRCSEPNRTDDDLIHLLLKPGLLFRISLSEIFIFAFVPIRLYLYDIEKEIARLLNNSKSEN